MYADYDYYLSDYLKKDTGKISGEDFDKYSSMAAEEMQYYTMGTITEEMAGRKEIKDCCCAMAEEIYKYETARENESGAVISSWSNDGESGSYDVADSEVTQKGHNAKKMQIARRYLLRLGLLNRRC